MTLGRNLKIFTDRRIYISASISELTSLASGLKLSLSLIPCTSMRIFKMNKSSARQILQGTIQQEPKGVRCSRAACWQIEILLKTAATAMPTGSNSQSHFSVRT